MMTLLENLAHQISANDDSVRSLSVSITRATDIDEFLKKARGYRLGFTQIDRGRFAAESLQTRFGGALLSAAQYGRALIHSGEPPSATITFAARTSAAPALWQGHEFGTHDLLVGKPGVEIDLVSQPGFGVATASFPVELVEEAADRFGWQRWTPTMTSVVVGLQQGTADRLLDVFTELFKEALARPVDNRAAVWAVSKGEDLLRALLRVASGFYYQTRHGSGGERARVLRAALEAINDRSEDVLTIGDLCRIARASERTLHYAFTERFGLPPAHYMKAQRLNGARDDLRRGDPSLRTISDVANKWGFWHLGQFAKDYRNWFGELPSDTYRRSHGINPPR